MIVVDIICRSFSATSQSFQGSFANLKSFRLLRVVNITFFGQTISTQSRAVLDLFFSLPSSITELTLNDLADIDICILRLIAHNFPDLVHLELTCSERLDDSCCWSCFEESSSCVWHSPIPDRYLSVESFVVSAYIHVFGVQSYLAFQKNIRNVLQPLKKLKHLHLGLFLSSEDILYDHLVHAQDPENEECEGGPYGPEWCLICFHRHAEMIRLQ